MVNIIRATTLGTYNVCPYKYKNDKTEPDLNIIPGNILNIAVNSNDSYDEFLEYYVKHFNGDFKQKEILKMIFENARDYANNIKSKYRYYQETTMYIRIGNTIVSGTPDMYYFDNSTGIWNIIDWKTSNSATSWYGANEIWDENLQWLVYSILVGEYFKVDKTIFKFVVFDKKNGKMYEDAKREVDVSEGKELLKKIIMEYEDSIFLEEYKAKKCRYCNFCSIKQECPLYRKLGVEEIL